MANNNTKTLTNRGRPAVVTEDIIKKLREAYLIGATDREACAYADISNASLYNYQNDNPDFIEQKKMWKQQPILAARNKVVTDIKNDVRVAQWYLERKKKREFSVQDKKDDRPNQQLNIIMGNDADLAQRLTRLFSGTEQRPDPSQT